MRPTNATELLMVVGWFIWWGRCRPVHEKKIGKAERSAAIRGIGAKS